MSYLAAKSIRSFGLRALLPARSQLVTHIPYTRSMGRYASGNHEILGNGFLQASSKTHQPTKLMRRRVTQQQATSNPNHIGLQYDAISGRMVPSGPQTSLACPPGSELDALLRSNTSPTVDQTPNLSVECPPGHELEAKFIADPASRSDLSLPSELNNQRSNGSFSVTIDCSPGNELEVKFTTELGGLGIKSVDPVQTKTGPQSRTSQQGIDCSPGSELEAHILSQSAGRQPIDCSPGYELEANFIANPGSAEYGQFKPAMIENTDNSKKATFNIDCPPGSELEALFISDSASCKGSNTAKDPISVDTSEDCADDEKDFIIQNHTPGREPEAQSSVSQKSSPEFRILSFDASTSQVSTANADLFFGAQEDLRTNDILSRLHSPAEFLPHLGKMQMDGYEIATGGGDILVFRKIHAQMPPKTGKHNSDIHAEIVKHLRHDSIDPTPSYQRASRLSTAEPRSTVGPCTPNPEAHTKSRTSFREMIRRMIFAGTATAATCYAIGVVTEFFRTGGNYRRGADGFTVLDSDRRHRE